MVSEVSSVTSSVSIPMSWMPYPKRPAGVSGSDIAGISS